METEKLLPCSQDPPLPLAGLYPVSDQSSPHPPILFIWDLFNIILPRMPRSSQ
jgi:hypothetical protein